MFKTSTSDCMCSAMYLISSHIFPGKYSPEKYPIPYKKRAPSYSFGGRFADPKADKSPAPNNYALPSLFGKKQIQGPSAPSYSIRGRPKIGPYYENLQKVLFDCLLTWNYILIHNKIKSRLDCQWKFI